MSGSRDRIFLADLWTALGGSPNALDAVDFEGPPVGLPSIYALNEAAAAWVAAATLAVAELHAVRTGESIRRVAIERAHVVAAFRSERNQRPVGWKLPGVWDSIAGDYETRDGWIRLHTNYVSHRDAVLRVLGTAADRDAVTWAVREWDAAALETAVVESGGCAAAMHTATEWSAHPQGAAVAAEPPVHIAHAAGSSPALNAPPDRPLTGVRVLDLTRVIAGPVCTRVLAWYGADVMRVDPPGFEEVPALLGDTTAGKRRVSLDLRSGEDRATFEQLVAEGHVLVSGYRGGALDGLGYSTAALRRINPSLIHASLDAYGYAGPWATRRGFDSLVQMSCGIAARGSAAMGMTRPHPLPAQALDHGTGYLLAAAVCRALARGAAARETWAIRGSLARTAQWLTGLGDDGDPTGEDLTAADASQWLLEMQTPWGPLGVVRCPGHIAGIAGNWERGPGPLGCDTSEWT